MIAHNGAVDLWWEEGGSGPDLLLIHGLGYGIWGWEPLRPLLEEHFRVVVFDNRGVGKSTVAPGPYTAEQMASDAVAVMDAAGMDRAHVVGTSLGGMIAQELALAHPERVGGLVLLSTTPGSPHGHPMPEATVKLLTEAGTMEPAVALRLFVENALGTEPDQDLVDRIMTHRLGSPQDPAGWAAQAAAGTLYAGGDRTAGIAAPTLALSGTADRVVDARNTELLAGMIPGAVAELVDDGGHLVFWEQPELVARMITAFLESHEL